MAESEIAYRTDFSLLCNGRGIQYAIEVGTDRGVFAKDFMSRWNGKTLYCVDPYDGAYFPDDEREFRYDRTADRLMAVLALQPWHGRVRFIGASSPQATVHIPTWDPIGFIYIDASHVYEAVAADIAAWWGVLADEGILAGHDYDASHPGVMRAVDELVEREGLTLRLTTEELASWYVYKGGEPKHLMRRFFSSEKVPNPLWRGPVYG